MKIWRIPLGEYADHYVTEQCQDAALLERAQREGIETDADVESAWEFAVELCEIELDSGSMEDSLVDGVFVHDYFAP
jgi:hypothetical protein